MLCPEVVMKILSASSCFILNSVQYRLTLERLNNCVRKPYHGQSARPYKGCSASHQRIPLPAEIWKQNYFMDAHN